MGRTASPAIPGTDPTTSEGVSALSQASGLDTDTSDVFAADTLSPPADESTDEKIARQQRDIDELRALVHQMGKNQAVASAELVKLPTMKTVQAQKPNIPALTEDGWYVPAVHPTDRLAKN